MPHWIYVSLLGCLLHKLAVANNCDAEAQRVCREAHKNSCREGSSETECGDCLEGYSKIANVCVDASKCTGSKTPSKMLFLLDSSYSLSQDNFRKEIDLARDLVNVFPVNGFAIRTFATKITPYPKSGEFVDKNTALSILPGIPFVGGATYTGKAIQEAIDLLENERDSFNIVVVFTDGQASDGKCKKQGYTCDKNPIQPKCRDAIGRTDYSRCTLEVTAPALKGLADRNQTVTVVAVGFGQVHADELKLIASKDDNVILAEGTNAATGFGNLVKILDQLVDKVCGNLPEDCQVEYTPWTKCDASCGDQTQIRKIKRIVRESRNGGTPCPSGKALSKNFYQDCPTKPKCTTTTAAPTTTTTAAPTTTTTTAPTITTTTASTISTTTTRTTSGAKDNASTSEGTQAATDKTNTDTQTEGASSTATTTSNGDVEEKQQVVDAGSARKGMWMLMVACCTSILFV